MRFRSGVRAESRRKPLTGAHAARPLDDKQGLKVAAAVIVPLIVAVALIAAMAANDDGDGASTAVSTTAPTATTVTASPEAQAFQAKVDEAFKPLGDAIKTFLPKAQEFEAGKVPPADFQGAIDVALPELVKSRDAVAALEPYKPEPAINTYFLDAAELYVETARTYGVAVDPAAEPLRAQLNIAAKRLRTLGDRIYDRGRTVLDPGFYAPSSAEVEIRPPTEVPDWVAEGMAAGPPLAETPGPPSTSPPVREPTCGDGVAEPCREEESEKKWSGRVKDAGFPQAPEVVRALEAGDAAKLAELAATYETKTRELMAGADPKGDRERAAVIGLGLLTNGEAARLAQAATMLPPGEPRNRLLAVARRTLVVGDDLLEAELGFDRSGLPRSLLTDTGL
ncbi:MAG TPA: hypothetical protein VEG38_14620 [Acidimicrobiia bacterium]|nr:hypothetical protein [Acidimicrobiia bacterium]